MNIHIKNYLLLNIIILLIILFSSCSGNFNEEIDFIKNGELQFLELHGVKKNSDGYFEGKDEYSLEANQAIYGDRMSLRLKVNIGDLAGMFVIVFGDNNIMFINRDDQNSHVISGPAIGKTVRIGSVDDYLIHDRPILVSLLYEKGLLVYSIDGKQVFSKVTIIPPSGKIAVRGEHEGEVQIYEMICEGQFMPLSDFYTKEFLLNRAESSLATVAKIVKKDPNRPAFHFQPPANWNNDPNGMMYYNGYYHMFYQHNPYDDVWDWMHWGHARSKDLVNWEHLPIALWPSVEKGEDHCFSGSAFIKDDGKPILFYTSIGHENPEHWAAIPLDEELLYWEKHPANPIIVMEDHNGKMIDDWRDPFLFREKGDTYMVIGGHQSGAKGSIMMYKAMNSELTKWDYIGSPFEGQENNWECPNFFKVGEKFVLIYSPHGQVEYYTGTLDLQKMKFIPDYHGSIDNGASWNYYAPNTLQKKDGRRILFGWIPEFKLHQGWQGAISLPRDLSIDEKGRLLQTPVTEINKLRNNKKTKKDLILSRNSIKLDIDKPQFDLEVNLKGEGAESIGFRFNDENGEPFEIIITQDNVSLGKENIKVEPAMDEKINQVRLLFDRTIIEIFVNDGLLCATKVIYPDKNNLNFEIFSKETANIKSLDIWEMASIWN